MAPTSSSDDKKLALAYLVKNFTKRGLAKWLMRYAGQKKVQEWADKMRS